MSSNSIEREAVRMLFILYYCGEKQFQMPLFDDNDYTHDSDYIYMTDYTRVVDSESKLQKIDFWLRYPDHFAAALLHCCETGKISVQQSSDIKQIIRQIFVAREPSLRWIPMRKYLRGAYEPLDEVLSFLSSRNLAYKRVVSWGHRSYYFLTSSGYRAVNGILQESHECLWYAERCQLIMRFFGSLNGFEIRKLQYLQGDYSAAPYNETISRIEAEIQQRFCCLYGEALLAHDDDF